MKHIYYRLKNRIYFEFGIGTPTTNLITRKEIEYCYRLLLNRKPAKAELASQAKNALRGGMPRESMVDIFMHSKEFATFWANFNNATTVVELPTFKLMVNPNDRVGGDILAAKSYEKEVTQAITSVLKPGQTFVDIGANIGYFTMLASTLVEEDGKIIAFEPGETNCKLVTNSMHANNFANIELHQLAVSNEEKFLNYHGGGATSNGYVSEASDQSSYAKLVKAVALDDFLINEERLDVIKMDIEGAEGQALAGMKQVIQKFRPTIFTEFSPTLLKDVSQVEPEDYLAELNAFADLFILFADYPAPNQASAANITHIMEVYQNSNRTHLDLMAVPR